MSQLQYPVFYDPKGNRWRAFRRIGILLTVFGIILIGVFLVSVVIFNPNLPKVLIKATTLKDTANDGTPDWALETAKNDIKKPQLKLTKPRFVQKRADSAVVQTNFVEPAANSGKPLAIGFYVNWDDTSYASLKRNITQLDWIVPEWIRLQDGDDPLIRDFDQKALDLMQKEKPKMVILPLVQNYQDEVWNSEIAARILATEETRRRFINTLLQTVEENHFGGVTIDIEEVPKASQENLYKFMTDLHQTFHEKGLIVAQAVPFDNPDWDYQSYAAVTDYLMLMAYDEHWSTSAPGAIASQSWFEQKLAIRMKDLNPAKTIVCIGNYGYDWSNHKKEANDISFQEAVLAARDSEAKIKFDAASQNPYFSYDEEDGSHHTIWFLDSLTAFNEIHYSQKFHPAGYALWRLGAEDPSLWSIFGTETIENPKVEDLKKIRYGYDIDFEGTGEILQVTSEPQDGARDLVTDETNGSLKSEDYTATPSSFVIRRTGDRRGLVALTFDDGPDPLWTPKILDILKQENVPASFYIIGQNGQANPDLVRRIVAEGHDIGNHSYTHPNMGEMPESLNVLELNATQRLIESITGRSTNLMRPPYFGDAEPTTADEVEPIVLAKRLGYITVGLHVDPDDWAQPGSAEIVRRTLEGITNDSTDADQRGQIVLLHDSGGNRQQTVDALPQIIEQVRAKGFRFVTTSELAGLTQAETMPPVPVQQQVVTQTNSVFFKSLSWLGVGISTLFMAGIFLGIGRVALIGFLSAVSWRKNKEHLSLPAATKKSLSNSFVSAVSAPSNPFVSIIVPAFKEEKVIVKTINALLRSDYQNFEIIIVDDGSPDRTSELVRENFGNESRVRLFSIENEGKGVALNFGFLHSTGEIIIGLDADTHFEPQTIRVLVEKFDDEKVGAVAGNAKVGNRINLVTKWQALEYITAQNLERRAFAWLNAITVVPGAVGAWRRGALEKAGGFLSNTLAEDQDLTLKVRQLGYKIAYAEKAIAWTEAPDTFSGLAKQRFRWAYGTLQCQWKHRRALFNPRFGALGMVAMPNVWLFQIFFQMVSPLMDAMMIWAIIAHLIERLQHPKEFDLTKLENVVFYYTLFLIVDLISASLGFLFEPKEDKKLLLWLPLQRFGYRQVMYSVMVRSVFTAIRGIIVGWNKIERKDTVQTQV